MPAENAPGVPHENALVDGSQPEEHSRPFRETILVLGVRFRPATESRGIGAQYSSCTGERSRETAWRNLLPIH